MKAVRELKVAQIVLDLGSGWNEWPTSDPDFFNPGKQSRCPLSGWLCRLQIGRRRLPCRKSNQISLPSNLWPRHCTDCATSGHEAETIKNLKYALSRNHVDAAVVQRNLWF